MVQTLLVSTYDKVVPKEVVTKFGYRLSDYEHLPGICGSFLPLLRYLLGKKCNWLVLLVENSPILELEESQYRGGQREVC